MPDKVVNSLNNSPGAHVGRDLFLVSKLEVIEAEDTAKEIYSNPVELLEDERSYTNTSIVLGHVDTTQLILDNGDQS